MVFPQVHITLSIPYTNSHIPTPSHFHLPPVCLAPHPPSPITSLPPSVFLIKPHSAASPSLSPSQDEGRESHTLRPEVMGGFWLWCCRQWFSPMASEYSHLSCTSSWLGAVFVPVHLMVSAMAFSLLPGHLPEWTQVSVCLQLQQG